jgi:hypothetical protein
MNETTEVRPGQVWADNDPRSAGRTLRVDSIDGGKAICTILTNSSDEQAAIECPPGSLGYTPKDTRGKTTRISLSRIKPTRTGYRLIEAPELEPVTVKEA